MSLRSPEQVRDLQQSLARKSKSEPKYRFYALYDKVYRMDVLTAAWLKVKANRGSGGVDGVTLGAIQQSGVEAFLVALQADLKTHAYRPQALRRVYIPKASGGPRPLSIPTVRDRVVQQAVRMIVEPIFEVRFSPASFGFRPGRGAQQAVKEVEMLMNWGLVQVVETDIQDCFGTIPHQALMKKLASRIADGQILKLIRQWLKCGVMEDGQERSPVAGTPQGGVISPLLANVYLDGFDHVWAKQRMSARTGYNAHLVRYADDLVILTDKSPKEPERLMRVMLEALGLQPHPKKTRVLDAREGHYDFLGFNFRKRKNPRTGKWFTLVRPSQKAQQALKAKLRAVTDKRVNRKVSAVVEEMNPILRGWVNYFRIGQSASVFNEVREYALGRVRRYLRRRQGKHGYGWKNLPNEFFYGPLGLFYGYQLVGRPTPAWRH